MGLFDNIFGLFTGSTAEKAAEQQRQALQGYLTQIGQTVSGAQSTGLDALRSNLAAGRDVWSGIVPEARLDIEKALTGGIGNIAGYGSQAANALTGGVQGAAGALDRSTQQALDLLQSYGGQGAEALRSGTAGALGAYDPLGALSSTYGARGTGASDMMANALGLGGPEGTARVQAAFQASPGYQFNLTQGLDAINRARAMRGELSGGNIDRDTQTYGAGLASREYGDYLNRLSEREGRYVPLEAQLAERTAAGQAGMGMTGAQSLANLFGQLGIGGANLASGSGRAMADLLATGGARMADIQTGVGTNLANLQAGAGGRLADIGLRGAAGEAGLYSTEGTSIADLVRQLAGTSATATTGLGGQYAKSFMDEAAAKSQGASNFLDMLGNIATFGAKAAGFGGFGAKP